MAKLPRIHVPLLKPEDVIPHLGKLTHWKQGRSAKAVAESWFHANDIPPAVRAVLDQAPEYRGAELIDAWLERCVDLGDGQRPTQTDLMAVLGIADELAVLAVEAKVDESFGPTVDEWLVEASEAKQRRLVFLAGLFGLDPATCGPLRYQFLHRTASAVLEARRYRTKRAVMLVQSFCPDASGLEDYRRFFGAIGLGDLQPNTISRAFAGGGLPMRVGWVADVAPPARGTKADTDPLEEQVAQALASAGLPFLREYDPGNLSRLDFHLPSHRVEIEVKRFHSERIAAQMARAPNVIALQGERAVKLFCDIILKA